MPTIYRFGPYRVYFFAHENQATREPPHVHVRSGKGLASFWLSLVRVRDTRGTLRARSTASVASSAQTASSS